MIEIARLINNQKIVAEVLKTLPPLKTTVLDNVYPVDKRRQHPFAQIGIEEVADTVMTVPVVRRGAPGVPVSQEAGLTAYIEPQPIRIEDSIGAKEANDIKALGQDWKQFLAQKLDRIRRKVRATTEALAAQSLTGKIQYPLLLENGTFTTYEVDFTRGGANPILTYTPATAWNASDASIPKVLNDLITIEEMMQENGFGSRIRFWAGKEAFKALMSLSMATRAEKKLQLSVEGHIINVAGYQVELMNAAYKNPQTGDMVKVVGENELLAWDEDAPFTLFYLAIDHFKAGLKATPLFVYSYEAERGDTFRIFAESKPLPCPVVKAICKATVVS